MIPKNKKTFCVMPWINLSTETNGKCKICCVVMSNKYIKNNQGEDFHIHKDNIETIWNSNYILDIRKKMLNDEWPEDCFYCEKQELNGVASPREDYNQRWPERLTNFDQIKFSEDGYSDQLPISLEPRPGILCDLKCHSCWSMSSSKIFSERTQLLKENLEDSSHETKNIVDSWTFEIESAQQSDFNWSNQSIYLDNIKKCGKNLQRLYFTGGEPTLIKSNQEIIDYLIENKKNDVLIAFTTNLNFKSRRFFENLHYFDSVEITGSIEAVAEKNTYIRYPSEWQRVIENIRYLISLPKNIHFSIMTVLQALNIKAYIEMLDWFSQDDQLKDIPVTPTYIQSPDYLKLEAVSVEIKLQAISLAENLLNEKRLNSYNQLKLEEFKNYLRLNVEYSPVLNLKFKTYIKLIDNHRKTDFKKTFSDLENI